MRYGKIETGVHIVMYLRLPLGEHLFKRQVFYR